MGQPIPAAELAILLVSCHSTWLLRYIHHFYCRSPKKAQQLSSSKSLPVTVPCPYELLPYETIAVATHRGLAIWHLGLSPDSDGRPPVERVALLPGHDGKEWQMEWDTSGITLATTGDDRMVRLRQSNLNDVWHQQAAFEPTS